MLYQVIISLLLVSSALSANYMRRGFVEWFEIQKAPRTHSILSQQDPITDFSPYQQAWEEYKDVHSKSYERTEEFKRFQIFSDNVKKIEEHNKKFKDGKSTYIQGVNQFTDMTRDEFIQYNGLKKQSAAPQDCSSFIKSNDARTSDSVDWREKGYVTPVKNQGQCGSCWSFSTTGSLEGQYFRKKNKLVSFSEQQLVDCSGKFGNEGCNGGLMDQAFGYVKQYGIEKEKDYPYTAMDDKCKYKESKVVTKDSGCTDVESGDEDALKAAVSSVGPVSVAIDASHSSFQSYRSGVYTEEDCSSTQLDHGVLVVGYGSDDGEDYWIVKNSWGESWGEEGYIKMSRNNDNMCGIATSASYPML